MPSFSLGRGCIYHSRFGNACKSRHLSPIVNHARHYARRQPTPAFNSGGKPNSFEEAGKTAEAAEENEQADGPKRFRIGPVKIILLSIIAFTGYKVYNWQTDPSRSSIFNPRFFTPFILESKDQVSSTSSVLNLLSVPRGQNTNLVHEAWSLGVWSVQVMQPELQIARSYTPLPPGNGLLDDHQIRLFVRKEPHGEVSGFLHRISPGTLVHLRGPKVQYEIPKDVDEVVFLAGGTGIAPALQVAYSLFTARQQSAEHAPRMRILWANRRREDSYAGLKESTEQRLQSGVASSIQSAWTKAKAIKPSVSSTSTSEDDAPAVGSPQTRLVEEVESLKTRYGDSVDVQNFFDEDGSTITESILRRHLETEHKGGEQRRKLILVSGPEGFVDVYAGPKQWQAGKEVSGPVRGMLSKINPQGWDIWKL